MLSRTNWPYALLSLLSAALDPVRRGPSGSDAVWDRAEERVQARGEGGEGRGKPPTTPPELPTSRDPPHPSI